MLPIASLRPAICTLRADEQRDVERFDAQGFDFGEQLALSTALVEENHVAQADSVVRASPLVQVFSGSFQRAMQPPGSWVAQA